MELAGEDTVFFAALDAAGGASVRRSAVVEWTHGAESLKRVFRMHKRNSVGEGEARMWPLRFLVLALLYAGGGGLMLRARRGERIPMIMAAAWIAATIGRDTPGVAIRSRSATVSLVPLITASRDLGMLTGYAEGLLKRRS